MRFFIRNHLWIVFDVPRNYIKLKKQNGSYVLGATYCDERAIYMNRDLSSFKYERVLAHEITHAFIYEYGINIEREEEEKIANLFAEHGREMIAIVDNILMQIMEVA